MAIPTREELRKFKVVELRQRLSKLGLSQAGIKEDLITRVIDALQKQSAEASPEEAEEVTEESGQDGAGREAMEVEDAAASPEPALNVPPETTPPKPAAVECSETSVMEEASQNETSTDDKLPTDLAPEPTAVAMGDRTEAVERPETQVAEEVSRNETSTGDKLPVELAPAASIPEPTTVATGDRTKVPAPEEKAHQAPPSKEEERNAVAELPPVSSSGHTHFRAGAPPRDSGAGEVGVVRRSPTRRPIGPQPANLASGPIGPQPTNLVSGKASAAAPVEGKAGKKKKKKRRRRRHQQVDLGALAPSTTSAARDVEIEYVQEDILQPTDAHYRQFHKIFEQFKLSEPVEEKAEAEESPVQLAAKSAAAVALSKAKQTKESDSDEDEEEKEAPKMSKKKLRKLNRLSVAELKQLVERPDVVEMHDVTAQDPKLLIHLKSARNTVPVPRHWCFKRKYLQGKRGIEKPPFNLPDFIKATGITEMRQAFEEKEDQKSLKQKTRERVRPKMGKLMIDYQKLHDAFFKWQTRPKMTIHGSLYYEGKEFETRLKEKKPGDLSDELRRSLGMPIATGKHKFPPPWLVAMQRYGPPPSYPNLKIPGLNAPIPEGCSFGYFVGGWGKPPVDEQGRPLYGDVFGVDQTEGGAVLEEEVDKTLWGELESEEEEESSEEEESGGEEGPRPEDIQAGLVTPMEGLITPSGLTSIPAGLETPEMIQLRKKKIEEAMEQGGETPVLYTVLPEMQAAVGGAMMGSAHVYDVSLAVPVAAKKSSGGGGDGVEVSLDPSELDLDAATMTARYEEQLREKQGQIQKEDLSDMVAEHTAKKKRKRAAADSGGGGGSKSTKKFKEFKF